MEIDARIDVIPYTNNFPDAAPQSSIGEVHFNRAIHKRAAFNLIYPFWNAYACKVFACQSATTLTAGAAPQYIRCSVSSSTTLPIVGAPGSGALLKSFNSLSSNPFIAIEPLMSR